MVTMRVSTFCVAVLAFICHSHSLPSWREPSQWSEDDRLLDPNNCASKLKQQPAITNPLNFSADLLMPGVVPDSSDTYLCASFPVPTNGDAYVVDFLPHASMDTVHHMILFGCRKPLSTKGPWDCGNQGTCKDTSSTMYAWARNAPPTKLPKDVGFKVGGKSGISHFVLQIHYGDITAFKDHHIDCSGLTLRMTTMPQPFIAGIYLLMTLDTVILPGKTVTNADVACDYSSYPIYPFAFRTHTHSLGKVVSGYRVRDGKWSLIGRQSPQLPQAFYPANKGIDVTYGDTVAARCMFTGEGRTSKTYIGATSGDEMCNFYIMYYMESKHAVPYMTCMEPGSQALFRNIPAEANIPIAVPRGLGMHMHMGPSADQNERSQQDGNDDDQDQGDLFSLMSKLLGHGQDVVHVHKYDPRADLVAQIDSLMQKSDPGFPSATRGFQSRPGRDPVLVRDRVHRFHQLEATAKPLRGKTVAEGQDNLKQVITWPHQGFPRLGQVSGLALDSDSNLVIFHRGDHVWGSNTFDLRNRYLQRSEGPIQQSTILVVDCNRGNILRASGRNMFFLPHGITTDKDDNYWVTDVALHQVMKLMRSNGRDKVLLTLGQRFVPGSDRAHFCKPTDVALDKMGNVFVSDGYCNNRIVKFTADGRYLTEWGAGSLYGGKRMPFLVPHSLAYLPDRQQLCVADRENGRIQCFVAETGEFVTEITKEEFGGKVFAIAYSPEGGGLMYAVNGKPAPLRGFVIDLSTNAIVDTFSPKREEFEMPHDIVVASDGNVFVGDAGSNTVYKFTSDNSHRSVKKAGIEVQELEEVEAFVQTKVRPEHNASKATAVVQEKQPKAPQPPPLPTQEKNPSLKEKEDEKEKEKSALKPNKESGVVPAILTTLLLVPLVLVVSVGLFVCWRRNNRCEMKGEPSSVGGILGKIRGKAVGSLNLGNFFATHKGYSRQGFDQLSTEGSDQERHDDDSSDSENEEYSAPPLPPQPQPQPQPQPSSSSSSASS